MKIEGNPYLVPMEKHGVTLMYDKTFSKFTTRLFTEYKQHKNMIEKFITNDGDYSIQSYRNNGSWHNYRVGGIFTFQNQRIQGHIQMQLATGKILPCIIQRHR